MATKNSNHPLDFESILDNEVGPFGKYQLINLALIALPAIFSGFMAGDYIFSAAKLPHRCAVPQCDAAMDDYAPDWITMAIPVSSTGAIEDCVRYPNASNFYNDTSVCVALMFDNTTTVPCEYFVYERTNSVVYDYGLECDEWYRALAGTLNSLGGMFALPIAGYISDTFGRRTSVVIFSFNIALVGVVRAFSFNYPMYLSLQFLQTAIGGGAYSAAYILAAEIVGSKYRVATSAFLSSCFAMGQVLLGLIASGVYEWRTLSLVLFTPVFSLVSYCWILTESHRWLLSKNKQEAAEKVLKHAAKLNGKTMSEESVSYLLNAIPEKMQREAEVRRNEKSLLLRVLRSRVMLRRCCTVPVWWVTTTFVYYGLSINSVSLSGNLYYNYIATAAVEIPGYWLAVALLGRIGRKSTIFMGYGLCSTCCIAFAFIPSNFPILSLIAYLIGKCSIAVVFTSVYLYTSELFPTRHRHSLLGFSSMVGRIGSIVSPLTPPLMVYWSGIPSLMFGTMAAISAILVLTQPETLGKQLPDTIDDAERI